MFDILTEEVDTMAVQILAEEVDTMTVQGLLKLGKFFFVKDLQNMTESRWERLRSLANQRKFKTHADELDRKLEGLDQIARRPSPTLSECTQSTAPGPTLEEEIAAIYWTYKTLKRMGGRPSAQISPDPGPCDPSKSDIDKEYHVSDHWCREGNRVYDEFNRWKKFREYRKRVRGDPELFKKYIEDVSKHIRESGIEWTVQLRRQPGKQTKLDQWREYYIYEHRKRRGLENRLARVQQLPESDQRWNGRLSSAKRSLEQLDNLLGWIDGQFPEIAKEMMAIKVEGQANWQDRLRPRTKTTMMEHTIWRDRLRPRRDAILPSLEMPKTAERRTGKPKGIVKQYERKASKEKRRAATKYDAIKSNQQKAKPCLSSTQSLFNGSSPQAIPVRVTPASTAESSPQSIPTSHRGMKRRRSSGQASTVKPRGVRKDHNAKRSYRRGLKGATLTTICDRVLHLLTPEESD